MLQDLEACVKNYKIFLDVRHIFNANYEGFCAKIAPLLHSHRAKIYIPAVCVREAQESLEVARKNRALLENLFQEKLAYQLTKPDERNSGFYDKMLLQACTNTAIDTKSFLSPKIMV
ncbi:hypothetical protein [Helicobacter sp. L8]|uniref:hypothetical protein n=1 Tax=Helicobacter sp. L8 TaxID=2316078 RepID=UPI000EAF3987|nr:hypothetical protein [Helicobacter sp. L8]